MTWQGDPQVGYSQRSMSGPLNETPKQTAGNTLFQCPLTFLSASFPFLSYLPVTEIPPQKCKCCWRQTGTSSYYPCSQAVCHSPFLLSTSSGKEADTNPNKSVEHCSVTLGETGASVDSFLSSAFKLISIQLWWCPGISCQVGWTSTNSPSPMSIHSVLYSPDSPFPDHGKWGWGRRTDSLVSTAPSEVLSTYFQMQRSIVITCCPGIMCRGTFVQLWTCN